MSLGSVRFRLLGSVAAFDDQGPVRLGGPKQRTVLAALLLNADRVVAEDQLIEFVWGQTPPASARGQLQVRISELRKLLGRALIVRRSPGYLIGVRPGDLDLEVFETAVTEGKAELSEDRPLQAAERFRAALALWDEEPLAGVTPFLADRMVPVLEERRTAALEELYEAELSAARHAEVVGELRESVAAHPFRERLRGQLMLALHRSGRTADALAAYADAERLFGGELGIEPSAELRELRRLIADGQREPVVSAAGLPYGAQSFAGRSGQLAQLGEQLSGGRDATGICVIHGTAGVGKTALAVHWARGMRTHYPDGQLYVNLRGFDAERAPLTPEQALVSLLRALGVAPERIPSGLDAQEGLYRSLLADKRVLVLLDNAADGAQVLPLLPPSGTVLVTSRHRLSDLVARTGARPLPLDVLPPEDSRSLLTGVLGPARVSAEPEAAWRLAELCGNLPLALRVAAANLTTRAKPRIAELVYELSRGERLGAVTNAFDVSYQALPPQLRRLFRLLALIPGADFTAPVAAALVGEPLPEVRRRLDRLAAAHLLEQQAIGRFHFHDLLRDYARDRLGEEEAAAERDAAWQRLVEFYLATAESAEERFGRRGLRLPRDFDVYSPQALRFPDAAAAASWLDTEHGNLSALLRQAAENGPYPQAWYLSDTARMVFMHRGMRAEWRDLATSVLAAAQRLGEVRVVALMHQSIGTVWNYLERRDQAIHHLLKAMDAHQSSGWLEGRAAAMNALGVSYQGTGQYSEAAGQYEAAARLQRSLGSEIGEMMSLNNLGFVYRQLGRLDDAVVQLSRALELAAGADSNWGKAATLVSLGLTLRLRNEEHAAEKLLTEARELHREAKDLYGEAYALSGLSLLRVDAGDFELGREYAATALDLAERENNPETSAAALNALGRAEAALGRVAEAERFQVRAVDIARNWNAPFDLTEALIGLAALRTRAGDFAGALEAGEEGLALARRLGLRLLEARALLAIASVRDGEGERARAGELYDEALAVCREIGLTALEVRIQGLLARRG
ncbi:AfsR/SARP family transcriptional regulator [Amycolatopsis sp.]|uniref:AfsR/SARP family transcriptional regulator n=1 Tax=Amycolatopsis sp. TaxID=37632 RepID=UPI002BB5E8A8|nr:BTAD domain-containing putative transcriptional regulator [Amycolatopsis sp.]HVV07661.1 BTAD domain-containing putative transcriptional regulator [Amycolatopsis sp.]